MHFTLRLICALVIAALLAAVISPFAAVAVAYAGFRFPFPRIFDRTVMVTTAVMLIWWARQLRLGPLLRHGFARPARNLGAALRGFLIAVVVIGILVALAAAFGGHNDFRPAHELARLPKYIAGAIAVAVIEEGFFRAVLLGGMIDDFGSTGALVLSSAVYALAHLVRSPAHYYLGTFDPTAGFHNLAGSVAQFSHPATALPALLGLFLLGLVLGEAFLTTGTVYFAGGIHAGLVLGAKLWPYSNAPGIAPPHWISGYGHFPLISGVAAWVMTLVLLALIPRLAGKRT